MNELALGMCLLTALTPPATQEWIDQLGSQHFGIRQTAQDKLIKYGPTTFFHALAASEHKDMEIRWRAEAVANAVIHEYCAAVEQERMKRWLVAKEYVEKHITYYPFLDSLNLDPVTKTYHSQHTPSIGPASDFYVELQAKYFGQANRALSSWCYGDEKCYNCQLKKMCDDIRSSHSTATTCYTVWRLASKLWAIDMVMEGKPLWYIKAFFAAMKVNDELWLNRGQANQFDTPTEDLPPPQGP